MMIDPLAGIISIACDADHDRHGIVTHGAPNHYLAVAIDYLFRHRADWLHSAAVGKTLVSSQLIDRVSASLKREVFDVPIRFKWFASGLFEGTLGVADEESAGATFLRRDGRAWTTDKDGFVPSLLSAEIPARAGRDPVALYSDLTREIAEPVAKIIQALAPPAQKRPLAKLSPDYVESVNLVGDKIQVVHNRAPANVADIDGIKVETYRAWFAARPSGFEDIYNMYAESFRGTDHLALVLEEPQVIADKALAMAAVRQGG
ncbi:hypothetical protein [Zhongshania borealis]|uniref:Alpha-D-phosphohexomutase alpha/beta/alpha domain-containing protein n=1 Tax=Zhongshania borealis TaxID=889488 RepID=A0ABP7W668_9GAMM